MQPAKLLTFVAIMSLTLPAAAGELTGKWEIQSMGGDRNVTLKHQGKKITLYRVLWPEFEGEKYKLEHLYRGRIRGTKIKGQLLVKEDELPDWEVLRPFAGSISSNDSIIIDGLPMKRLGKGIGAMPSPAPSRGRASPPPSFGMATPASKETETAAAARKMLRRALELDPNNSLLKRDYERAKNPA